MNFVEKQRRDPFRRSWARSCGGRLLGQREALLHAKPSARDLCCRLARNLSRVMLTRKAHEVASESSSEPCVLSPIRYCSDAGAVSCIAASGRSCRRRRAQSLLACRTRSAHGMPCTVPRTHPSVSFRSDQLFPSPHYCAMDHLHPCRLSRAVRRQS